MGTSETVPGAINATPAVVGRLPPETGVEADAETEPWAVGPIPGPRVPVELQKEATVAKRVGGAAWRATTRVRPSHEPSAVPSVLRPIRREAHAPRAKGMAEAELPYGPSAVAHAVARRASGTAPEGGRARVKVGSVVPTRPASATLAQEARAPPVRAGARAASRRAPVERVNAVPAGRTSSLPVVEPAMVQAQAGTTSAVRARTATSGVGAKEGDDRAAKDAPSAPCREETIRHARANRLKTTEADPIQETLVGRARRATASKAVGGRDIAPDACR